MKYRHKTGPTKAELEARALYEFNRARRHDNLPSLTIEQYRDYIYGYGLPEHKKVKLRAPLPRYQIDPERDPSRFPLIMSSDPFVGVKQDKTEALKKSETLPVAPLCNKGAYQVLLPSEVKTAGRKV